MKRHVGVVFACGARFVSTTLYRHLHGVLCATEFPRSQDRSVALAIR
jgi:hypothetical protein